MKLRLVVLFIISSVFLGANDLLGQCPSPDSGRTIHDYVIVNETCLGDNDGSITITLNDGVPPFTQFTLFKIGVGAVDFEIAPVGNVVSFPQILTGLSPGEYFVRVDGVGPCNSIVGFDGGGNGLEVMPGAFSVGGTLTAGGPTAICENQSTPLMTLSGESGIILRWERDFNGGGFVDIGNGGSNTFSEVLAAAGTYTYQVIVQNGTCAIDISSSVIVTVAPASNGGTLNPPGPSTICEGQSTPILSLTGEFGTVVRWERQLDGGGFSDIGNGGSTTFSEILITAGTYDYQVVVQNGGCPIDISTIATVIVDPASVGGTLTAGGSTTICETGTTPLMTLAGETGTILNWERDSGSGFVDIGNGGSNTFSEALATAGTYDYRVVVQSGVCPTTTSNVVSITVDPTTVAGTLSATGPSPICEGSTADLSLAGETGAVVRWERDSGSGFVDIGNGGSTTLSDPLAAVGNYDYRVVVQSGVCTSATSNTVSFVVDPASVGGTLTAGGSTTICETGTTPLMTLAGETGTILNWERDSGSGFVDIGNGGSNTFSEALATAGTYDYRVVVQSGVCPTTTSNVVSITVDPTTVAGTLSATGPSPICEGSTADLSLAGETGAVVRWERDSGSGFVDIGNGGSTTLSDPLAAAGNYDYRVVVQSGVCTSATSNTVSFVVDPASVGGTLTAGGSTTICETGTTPLMTLAGETGTILNWERDSGSGFVDIGNGGSNTFSEALATAGTYDYRVVVQSGVCPTTTSNVVSITVDPTTVAGTLSATGPSPICEGSTADLSLAGETGAVVRWERDSGSGFVDIGNGGSTTLSDPLAAVGNYDYRVVVQSGVCTSATSNTVSFVVDPASVGGTLTAGGSTTICETGTTPLMTLAGETGTILNWERDSGSGFVDIGNGGSNTFSEALATAGTYDYRVVVQSGVCPTTTSNVVSITVDPTTVAGTLSATGPSPICEGSTADLSLAGETGAVVRWERDSGSGFVDIGNGGSTTLSDPLAAAGNYDYRVVVQSGVCTSATSNTVSFVVDPASVGGSVTTGGSTNFCEGGTTPSMDLSGETGIVVRWERSTDGFVADVTDIGFAGNLSITDTPPAAGVFDYRAVIQSGICPESNSTSLSVTVNALPLVSFTGLNISHCIDEVPVILTGSEAPNGTFSGTGVTDNGDGTASFDPSAAGLGGHSVLYSFTDINGCTGADVQPTTVVPLPTVSFSGLAATYCFDDTPVTLTGSPVGPPGTWATSAPGGITDNGDGTATFDPSLATGGTWDVTYTYTDGNGCVNFDTQSTLVHPQTIPAITGALVVCLTAPTQNYSTDTGQSGYVWAVIGGTIDSGQGTDAITVTWTTTGSVTVDYSDANSCPVSNSVAVNVFNSTPPPIVTTPVDICLGDGQPSLVIDNFSGQTVSWYADPGLFGLLSNSHPYTPTALELDTSVPGTTSFFVTQTVAGCGESAPAQIDVIVHTPPDAGTDATVNTCDTETTINLFNELGGIPDAGGTWTDDDGSGALVGVIFNPSVAGGGTFNFTYTTSTTGCTDATAVVTVIVEAQPDAGTDNAVGACVADTSFDLFTNLGGTPDPGGIWLDDDGSGALVGSIFDPSVAGTGTYSFTYSFTPLAPCLDVSATVTVTVGTVSPPPITDGPIDICSGDPIPVLNAIGANVVWYSDAGLTTMVGTGNSYTPGTEFDPNVAGLTQYFVTQDVGCGVSLAATYDLNVLASSNAPIITPVPDLCLNDPIPQIIAVGSNIIWHSDAAASDTLAIGDVFIPNPSQLDTDVISMTSFFATQDSGCGRSVTTETIVNVINCVGSCFIQNAVASQASCLDNDGSISFNLDGTEVLPVSFRLYELSGTDTVFQQTQSGNFFDSLSTAIYDYEIVDSQGCAEIGQVTVLQRLSTLDVTITPVDSIECIGELATFDVLVTGGGSAPFEFSSDGGLNWQPLVGNQIQLLAGSYDIFVRNDPADPCPYDGGNFIVDEPTGITYTIPEPTESFPERASGTITITDVAGGVPGYEVQADLIAPSSPYPGQSYSLPFTPIPFLTELGKYEIVLDNLFAGTYMIQIMDSNGCIVNVFYEGVDPTVALDDKLFIPNVFTPNGDGTNDFFFIRNMPDDTDTQLTVTNRYGKQVYGTTSYQNDWNGEGLPDGLYYYTVVVTVEGQEFDYKGWVEIWSGQ